MAAKFDNSRRNLHSVSVEGPERPIKLIEGTTRTTTGSLIRTHQSSEFHPKDSTIHDIWQYSQSTYEFNPEKMDKEVDSRRHFRNQSEFGAIRGSDFPPDNADRTSKRRINIQKSLQLLDEVVDSSKPFLTTASSTQNAAYTPTPLLQRIPAQQLRHSTYTPSGIASVAETDTDIMDMSMVNPDIAHGRPALTGSLQRQAHQTPEYFMGSISLMDETGLISSATPVKLQSGIVDDLTADMSQVDVTQTAEVSMLTYNDPVMTASTALFQEFKNSLVMYPHSTHVFDLVKAYEGACRKQVHHLDSLITAAKASKSVVAKQVSILKVLIQESHTWRLIASLFNDRLQSRNIVDDSSMADLAKDHWSEKKLINSLYERESSTRQNQLVIDWLEKNAEDYLENMLKSDQVEFFSESVCWENSLHELKEGNKRHGYSRPIVTELDPDAPLRQNRPLADLDMEDEARLLKHMFALIRAGKLEQAQNLCQKCGQAWRAATLNGWKLWDDPNMNGVPSDSILADVEGNPYRDVWKRCAWDMSNETKFNVYERAMYAAYCGNLKQLLPACESWEDYLWAYYKVMVDVRVEQELRLNARSDRDLENMPASYWDQALTPEQIFDDLNACPREGVKRSVDNEHHVIQRHIILDDIQGLLKVMNEWLQEDPKPANHMLRFMAHFALFLRVSGLEAQDELTGPLLKAYVQSLIDDHQVSLIATYTATLSPELQVETYAYFLEEIVERKERQMCLELAQSAGLEVPSITKTVVENIHGKDFSIVGDMALDLEAATSDNDRKKIQAIDWLVFDPSQRAEALKQGNAIMRYFVATRKHTAARELFNRIPPGSIDVIFKQWQMMAGSSALPADYDNAIREYLCIKAYLDAIDGFNDWFQHFHHEVPKKPQKDKYSNFTEKVALEQEEKQYKIDLERWQNTLEIHSKGTVERLYNVLLFPDGGWMVDQRLDGDEDKSARCQQLQLLRQLCIPLTCFLLHNIHQLTGQHKESIQLADIVASEQHGLCKVFRKDELQKFLRLTRNSSLSILESSMDPLGFDLPS